ncbi:MAG: helix-turn-helix domain-containing protein [Endomicrobiales bacterium]|jgi:cytoskeletal protein RodZ
MESIGKILLEGRLSKMLTQEEVHEKTRIPRRFIQALEEDDRSAFPAEVYYYGTIRTYARFLGLEASSLVIQARAAAAAPTKAPDAVVPQSSVPAANVFTKEVIIRGSALFIGILVFISIIMHHGHGKKSVPMPAPAPVAQKSQKKPQPVSTMLPLSLQTPTSMDVSLEITAVKSSWVKVVADGKTVFVAVMNEGLRKKWQAHNGYRVVIGYGPGVEVKVNNTVVNLDALPSDIMELTITREGVKIDKIQANHKTDQKTAPSSGYLLRNGERALKKD